MESGREMQVSDLIQGIISFICSREFSPEGDAKGIHRL